MTEAPLAVLLGLRQREEERARVACASAIAALRESEVAVEAARRAAAAVDAATAAPGLAGTSRTGLRAADLQGRHAFGRRLEDGIRSATARVEQAKGALARSREAHRRARDGRDVVERLVSMERARRRRAREAAEEEELLDAARAFRRRG